MAASDTCPACFHETLRYHIGGRCTFNGCGCELEPRFSPGINSKVTVHGPVDPQYHGLEGTVYRTWYKGHTLESLGLITSEGRKRVYVDSSTTYTIHATLVGADAVSDLKAEWEPINPKILPGAYLKPVETPHGVVYTNPEYDRNDEVVTNSQGGKQSRVDYAFTELEPDMLLRVTQVLHKGTLKYGAKNWRQIPYEDHLNHIAYHWTQLHAQDTTEDHLANIICRAMFAMYMKGKP